MNLQRYLILCKKVFHTNVVFDKYINIAFFVDDSKVMIEKNIRPL